MYGFPALLEEIPHRQSEPVIMAAMRLRYGFSVEPPAITEPAPPEYGPVMAKNIRMYSVCLNSRLKKPKPPR